MSERLDHTFAAETSATDAGGAAGTGLPRTALLYLDETLLSHVEQTLAAFRVPVVYRAAVEQVDHVALRDAQPQIALINLDDRCGDQLDAVTAALDAAGVPIVFNDADISNKLEGWARARWARHLCAKLCGKDDVDPPRPAKASTAMPADVAPAVVPVAEIPPAPAAPAAPPATIAKMPEVESPAGEPAPAPAPASASVPLTQGEIDALVADFPSEPEVASAPAPDTEAWSAQIDALLANAADSASSDPAPWEVVGFADDDAAQPAPAPAAAPAKAAAPAGSAAAPKPAAPAKPAASAAPTAPASADQWQLVDDFTPVATTKKPAEPAQSSNFGSGLSLELEPLNPTEDGQ